MTVRFALLTILMLVGCASASSTHTPTHEATQTLAPTVTSTSAPTRTPRPTRTLIPTLTNTPALPADYIGTLLFQGIQYPNCELPCWRGLVIGESTLQDVQAMLERDFQLSLPPQPSTIEHLHLIEYAWTTRTDGSFGIGFWIETKTQTLNTINFWWSRGHEGDMTPRRVIQELGAPDQWWFEFEDALQMDWYDSAMVYSSGLIFMHSPTIYTVSTDQGELAQFCLDDNWVVGSAFITASSEITLTEHPSLPIKLSQDIQTVRITHGSTIEDRTGNTIEEMVALALNSSQPCITFDY